MKKAIVTFLSALLVLSSKAQVAEFLSLKSTVVSKNSAGDFVQVKIWTVQQVNVKFDLIQKKILFLSKGLLDRDTFELRKEISTISKTTSPDMDDEKVSSEFSGIDRAGKKCTVILKLATDKFNIQDGELRVEYADYAEIYKIRTLRQNPPFNNG